MSISSVHPSKFINVYILTYILIIISIFMLLPPVCTGSPDEAAGIATKVINGSTIEVEGVGTVMMADIRCRDLDTPEGQAALQFAADWLENNTVHLDIDDLNRTDPYGRLAAVVYLEQPNGTLLNFNKMMVEMGYACIKDTGDNEFSPAEWWGGDIPVEACIKGQLQPKAPSKSVTCGGPYVGSMKPGKFRKFHYPTCPYAKRIDPSHQVIFNSAAEAEAYGFIPCMYCNPI
jgi:micrococcal nuclease